MFVLMFLFCFVIIWIVFEKCVCLFYWGDMKMYVMNVRVLLMYLRVCVKFYENLFVKCFILYVIKLCIVLMNRLNKN